jgi:hypothetical protein
VDWTYCSPELSGRPAHANLDDETDTIDPKKGARGFQEGRSRANPVGLSGGPETPEITAHAPLECFQDPDAEGVPDFAEAVIDPEVNRLFFEEPESSPGATGRQQI